jgi:uncharacterized protein Yka (UPF0111/DUF47 family)
VNHDKGPLWNRIFHARPDFLTMLDRQLDVVVRAAAAFIVWCDTHSQGSVDDIYQLEKDADAARVALLEALKDAYETPLDREDLDDLSRAIDDIVDGLRYTIRAAVALRVKADENIREMADNLEAGVQALRRAVSGCRGDRNAAQQQASQARHVQRLNERVYTQALARLLDDENDFKTVFRQREGYHQMLELSQVLETAAERVEHALNKLS